MKLGTKLITTYLGVGLIPLAGIGAISWAVASGGLRTVSDQGEVALETAAYDQLTAMREIKEEQISQYFAERQGDMGVLVETVETLRSEAFTKLCANRDVKRAAVERYFQSINDQVLTFSEDIMIIEAMRELKQVFGEFRNDCQLSEAEAQKQKDELRSYYTEDFSAEYRNQNDGHAPSAERFFDQLDEDTIALQYAYIWSNPNPLGSKHVLDRSQDESRYSDLHARIHPAVRSYLDKFGYYDIFLVDSETGNIVYSVFKELDFATSLIDGPYADTNFGEAFRAANAATNADAVVLVDYKQYFPSYEAPASFIASPVFDGDKKIGVAMFQMPIDRLNTIMGERSGLGETGETYLVGPDLLMRSDSYLDPENHSVVTSFRHPENGMVDTAAAHKSLAGKSGTEVVIDYNSNPVLSAYCPVEICGLTWGLMAEIDVAEAFCPKDEAGEDFFKKYAGMYGYYDLFLANPDGYCFYTVAKEADYQTNLVNGTYANSGLGRTVSNCLKTRSFAFGDFAPYAPSNDAPAAFIAQPVLHDGEVELIVALQLSQEAINKMMNAGANKEKAVEAYLVGSDHYMRSDSFLDPDSTVASCFKQDKKLKSEAITEALSGTRGAKIIADSMDTDRSILSAYAPLDVFGTRWALLCEVDKDVAMSAVAQMSNTSESANRQLVTWVVGALGLVSLIVTLIALSISRSISKPLTRIIAAMSEGANQVSDAAFQVSNASQQLAEGASEQASSLEETSQALQGMASITRTNVENANKANTLSGQAKNAAQEGDKTMLHLNEAMAAINESSGQISKIIKVIEEIAFQTNLLALNAAVEAARAGEHGKGFAVVADEVRNLAQRAAVAAQETTSLIGNSVSRAKEGTDVAGEVGEALSAIVCDVTEVTDLVDEITKASEEQARGVGQVDAAVSQMDRVTQQNTAGAEESASAAEELSAQAATVKTMVDELSSLVGGHRSDNTAIPTTPKLKTKSRSKELQTSPASISACSVANDRAKTESSDAVGAHDEFMAMDSKDLQDF